MQERLAKAESNYKMSLTKIENLEDSLKVKDKKIGEIENQLHRELAVMKQEKSKKRADEIAKEKGKSNKGAADKQYEIELKKKDLEIFKLKEALKRSSGSGKEKAEADQRWLKFEVNNFYDGLENDFNLLDGKKSEVYRNLGEEAAELRNLIMNFYSGAKSAIRSAFSGVVFSHSLTWPLLNKPIAFSHRQIEVCYEELIDVITKGKPRSHSGGNAWTRDNSNRQQNRHADKLPEYDKDPVWKKTQTENKENPDNIIGRSALLRREMEVSGLEDSPCHSIEGYKDWPPSNYNRWPQN